MIAYIRGKIVSYEDECVIVDVNNIGYEIFVSSRTLKQLIIGKEIKIYTYHYIKEDTNTLYGFLQKEELDFFEKLISISGIGPKYALLLLSLSVEELKKAIVQEDIEKIKSIKGIGTEKAKKVISELKDKIKEIFLSEKVGYKKAIDALVSLGYSRQEARTRLEKIRNIDKLTIEETIKEALKNKG